MKWSDGAPFTADDIMFYIEDILFNEELSVGGPSATGCPVKALKNSALKKLMITL
jgi:ABC-type transport system substrate-binding protein